MNDDLRQLVWDRATSICEYCRVPQVFDPLPFGIDHIRPQYHHGPTEPENLCLWCFQDNTFKAVNVTGYDPVTGALSELFHPRRDAWEVHFGVEAGRVVGKTTIDRTTVDVLRMNLPERIEHLASARRMGRVGFVRRV